MAQPSHEEEERRNKHGGGKLGGKGEGRTSLVTKVTQRSFQGSPQYTMGRKVGYEASTGRQYIQRPCAPHFNPNDTCRTGSTVYSGTMELAPMQYNLECSIRSREHPQSTSTGCHLTFHRCCHHRISWLSLPPPNR